MAIDVDWVTGKISIPRADMPVVQASPELRSLDVAQLKLDLGTLHASEQGAPYPHIFTHNPEATSGGYTYARVINIIPPYFVEFEDGQYGVLAEGANHNLMDITVQNQVRLATQNSGGLIREPANTEMALDVKLNGYMGAIWVDAVNGTPGQVVGENGKPGKPVISLADTLALADLTGYRHIIVISGTYVLTSPLTEFLIECRDESEIHFNGQNINGSEFRGGLLKGAMSGAITVRGANIEDVSGLLGEVIHTGMTGATTLAAGTTTFADCYSRKPGENTPTLRFVPGAEANVRRFGGGMNFEDMTDVLNVCTAGFNNGQAIIDSSCTAGKLILRANCWPITDNSAGTVVDITGVVKPANIDDTYTIVKQILRHGENILEVDLINQELVLLGDDDITPIRRWPLETDGGENFTTSVGVHTKRKKSII